MALRKRVRLGQILVDNHVISEAQLQAALAEQKKTGLKLGRQLIDSGYLAEDRLLNFLSQQLDIPCIDLSQNPADPGTVKLLPETYARRFRVVLLESKPDSVLLGMADPTNIFALDEIERVLKRRVMPAVVRESEILRTIDDVYRKSGELVAIAEELRQELSENDYDLSQLEARVEETEAPVMRLLRSIFEDAVQANASDIHIEPDDGILRIRQRVDGVLQEHVMNEVRIAPALVLRLKLMSGLNISEKRIPQDGRFAIRAAGKNIDVRLSTMPIQHGESVVMRLLDQSEENLSLDQLGIPQDLLVRFRHFIHQPHGLILVTGPTGSGKTTTLYAALREINEPTTKIITVEDPVEYKLPRMNQVQVNHKIDLTFARVLRAALRQDPDILMIGEMRDLETAEIGLRAAMTGHLVFSTLHTIDSSSTASRLVDMGVQGFLVATALRAVLAQRLIRKLCEHCRAPVEMSEQEEVAVRQLLGERGGMVQFNGAIGCSRCGQTGYRGRIGIYELLEINGPIADALRRNDAQEYERAAYASPGFKRLSHCAMQYAELGVTSLEEVFRVAGEIDELAPLAAAPRA